MSDERRKWTTQTHAAAALGDALRTRRRELRLTQADVAKRFGTSAAHLSGVENGREDLSVAELRAWAGALDAEVRIELRAAAAQPPAR